MTETGSYIKFLKRLFSIIYWDLFILIFKKIDNYLNYSYSNKSLII